MITAGYRVTRVDATEDRPAGWMVGTTPASGQFVVERERAYEVIGRAEAHRLAGDDWRLAEVHPHEVLAIRQRGDHNERHTFRCPSSKPSSSWQQCALFLQELRRAEERRTERATHRVDFEGFLSGIMRPPAQSDMAVAR